MALYFKIFCLLNDLNGEFKIAEGCLYLNKSFYLAALVGFF